jgi:AraC family transcriptional regulator
MMSIQPEIVNLPPIRLMGVRKRLNLFKYDVAPLWGQLIPLVKGGSTALFYSVSVYDPGYFENFSPEHFFEKWAAVESAEQPKEPLEEIRLEGGLYAVFPFKGKSTDQRIFHYIYGEWLPQSPYILDEKPHFEVLGENYKPGSEDAEEEIFIPIKVK